jgi:DNA adenine methylase
VKPPLTYYGGKQQLSKLILSLIPKHSLYCEPFFGGGAVYFSKTPSKLEIINDTNGELMNFYSVLKSDFKSLQKEIQVTLHSRKEHEHATVIFRHPELFTPVRRAWAVWVLANQSFASKLNGSWGYDRVVNKSTRQLEGKRKSFTEELTKRIENTQIESTDAIEVIKTRDSKQAFFYCDPPYFNSHLGHYKKYTEKDFQDLLDALTRLKGKFLLSSYPSKLLSRYSKQNHWHTRKINMPVAMATHPEVKKKRKTEVLTANYPI